MFIRLPTPKAKERTVGSPLPLFGFVFKGVHLSGYVRLFGISDKRYLASILMNIKLTEMNLYEMLVK